MTGSAASPASASLRERIAAATCIGSVKIRPSQREAEPTFHHRKVVTQATGIIPQGALDAAAAFAILVHAVARPDESRPHR